MPAAWSAKDERMYQRILDSCKKDKKTCKRIAAATVNKARRAEGRTGVKGMAKKKPQRKQLGATMAKNKCRIVKTTTKRGGATRYVIECPPKKKPAKKRKRK